MANSIDKNEIYISYAEIDNLALLGISDGWVTTLTQALNGLVAQQVGHGVDISARYMCPRHRTIKSYIEEQVQKSLIYLIVLSEGYYKDEDAKLELKTILANAELNSGRIFILEMREVSRPPELQGVNGYKFWTEDKIRRNISTLGMPSPDSDFLDAVKALAYEMADFLNNLSDDTNNIDDKTQQSEVTSITEEAGETTMHMVAESDNATYFLHLSDLHFKANSDPNSWFEKLNRDLQTKLGFQNASKKLSGIIISGDITDKSTPEEYALAKKFLRQLADRYELSHEQLVIVPGNHDLNWDIADEAYLSHLTEAERAAIQQPVSDYIEQHYKELQYSRNENKHRARFGAFRNFYKQLTKQNYPAPYNKQVLFYEFPNNLLFIGFNSAYQMDRYSHDAAKICSVTEAQKLITDKAQYYKDFIKIAVLHHPPEGEIRNYGTMESLADLGILVILHGHIHDTDPDTRYKGMNIISVGTFGEQTNPLNPLQYNLLEFHKKKLIVHTRSRSKVDGIWTPDYRSEGKASIEINLPRR